jgi:hypothetical protein
VQSLVRPVPKGIAFVGGCDFETPPLSIPSGFCRAAQNYEVAVLGGYERVMGYERYSGRPSPSAGTAVVLDITLTGAIAVGNTVTGVTSAATGVVIAVPNATSIVVTKVSGAFTTSAPWDVLNVSGTPQATMTAAAHGASTALLRAQYKNLAADQYRADIAVPTGSGNSLGGIRFGGVLYTWRNNAAGTATNLWKSTSTGWSQITLYNEISFTVGAIAIPAEAATLAQGGVTATLKRLVLTSGTFAAGTAAGRLIITNPAGGDFGAGAATLTGGVTCTLTAIQTAITLLPSGAYKFVVTNFGGSVNTKRIYGCDGVNRGFEFDGDILVPITTGMTADAPSRVHAHKLQLFFSFGGSVQHAAPGTPYVWSVITGAAELGMGDTVTGFQSQPGSEAVGALAIFTRNRTSILYGTGVSSWQLLAYRDEIGAYADSIQDVGYTLFCDDQGITSLKTAQSFGNFAHAALSARIKTWVGGKRGLVMASCVVRDKSQYRLFFSNNYVLFMTFSGKHPAFMPIKLNVSPTWAWSSEESDGSEVVYFGATNGMVYQMEKGTSFDGDAIIHNISLAWDFLKSPRLLKRFHNCALEVSGSGYAAFDFSYSLAYASALVAQPGTQTTTMSFSSGLWDEAGLTWDSGIQWDGTTLAPSLLDMGGEAENVSLIIRGSSDYHEAIKFSGALIHLTPRRYLQ